RHTRFSRDWSSDVCSSDLNTPLSRDFDLRSRPGLQTFSPAGAGILRSHTHTHTVFPPLHCLLVARQCKVYIEKRFPVARDQANTPLSRDFDLRSRPGLQTFSLAGAGYSSLSHSHSHCPTSYPS